MNQNFYEKIQKSFEEDVKATKSQIVEIIEAIPHEAWVSEKKFKALHDGAAMHFRNQNIIVLNGKERAYCYKVMQAALNELFSDDENVTVVRKNYNYADTFFVTFNPLF